MSKRLLLSACTAALLSIAANAAHAQSFPNRPIRIIVAFPPGGATDVIARTVGTPLGQRLGQSVVVDNRPGSNGNISAELAANARPDGHTLLLGSDSLWGINPHLYSRMPVDLRKAFVPVTNLITNQIILTVNPDKVPSKLCRNLSSLPARPTRHCSTRRSATAASTTSRWNCSS